MKTNAQNYYLESVDFDPFAGPEIEQTLPLAKSQEEIWLSCKMGGNDANRAYNESVSLQFKGKLNSCALELALQDLVLRHQSLRTSFTADGTGAVVYQNIGVKLSFLDFSALKKTEQQSKVKKFLEEDSLTAYDLKNGPLFRASLFKFAEEEHYFTFSGHHLVCDGWSLGIFLQDLSKLYSAHCNGRQPNLPAISQMSDYIEKQIQFTASKDYQKTVDFWLEQFKGKLPETNLPLDFPRPKIRSYKSNRIDFKLDPLLSSSIKKSGASAGCSFVVTLFSAFEVFLHQTTGQQIVVLGLPAAGQAAAGEYGLTGHCVNLLPIKSFLPEKTTFKTYLQNRKKEILNALEHQNISLGTLLQLIRFPRDPSRAPLVPIVFNMDMDMDNGVDFDGLTYQLHYNPRAFETFEIFLNASGSEKDLTLEWSYNTELFKPETIRLMMESFETVLRTVSEEPERELKSILTIVSNISNNNLDNLNYSKGLYPQVSISKLISENLKNYAIKTAIRFRNETITHGELLTKANRLASLMIKKGIRKGDLVALALDRSIEMVIALLALMKAGAVYIPLDPSYPQERINFMLEDSAANFIVVNEAYKQRFSGKTEEILLESAIVESNSFSDDDPQVEMNGSDLIYVLYTSGSTGKPKGVQVTHHNLINLLKSIQNWPGISPDDRMLAISTISFDIAGLELFLPLISGAEMILADTKTAKDGFELLKLIKSEHVSLMQATPATFRMLIDSGWKEHLPLRIFCCGEALQPDLAKKLNERCLGLWNMYGPTETTIYSTGKQIFANDRQITIGKPIDNTQIYILNDQLNVVKEGAIGEIYIGGYGVAVGYLNRSELTAHRFPPNKFTEKPSEKMYRTGDIGRILPNGEVEYLGRADHQVKIRGHRVELGEIEAVLSQQEKIVQSVVVSREDPSGNQRLIAYVLASQVREQDQKSWAAIWKSALKEVLPPFMVPAHFIFINELPLTPNSKIDRDALTALEIPIIDENAGFIPPRTDVEKLVADIWTEVLGIQQISIDEDFFEIGGHSLTAVKIMTCIEEQTGQRLPLASLFESSTIESLSLLLQMDGKSITWDSLVPIRPKGDKTPLYMVHGAGLNVLLFNTLVKHLDPQQPVYGLQAKGLNGVDEPLDKLEDIAAHYVSEVLKQNPKGSYALAGYSFGGTIAYEMAKQLKSMGKEVTMLALFDSYADQTQNIYPFYIRAFHKIRDYTFRFLYTFMLLAKNPVDTFNHKLLMLKRKLISLYWKLNPFKPKEQVGFFGYSHEIDLMNKKAASNYLITPYDGAIELFRAKERTFYMADPKYLGWKKFALKGICVHEIPGDHNYIFAPPNDKKFAAILQQCLNQPASKHC